jgi:hypothetical protein
MPEAAHIRMSGMCAGRCRFDLVFSSAEGRFVDQIKTGRLDGRLEKEALDAQINRELTTAHFPTVKKMLSISKT